MRSTEEMEMPFHSNFYNSMIANDSSLLSSLKSNIVSEGPYDKTFSACDAPPDLLPTSFLTLFAIVYLVIIVVALLGNLLVILVIWVDRKMRTVTNVLLISLAGSDTLIAGLNMPFQLKFLIENEWTMGEGLCKFTTYMQGVVVVTSIFTLTGIAIDRYYAICRPLEARHLHTTGRALLLVGCFWLVAIVILIPQLIIQRLEPFLVFDEQLVTLHVVHMCVEYFYDHRLNVAYTCFFYAVLYVLPVAVMVVAYGRIGVTLWHRSPLLLAEAASAPGGVRADAGRRVAEKKRVVKMLVVIVAVFSVSWFPFFTAQVFFLFDGAECRHGRFNYRLLVAVIQVFAFSNSCVNPVIYCLLNDSFKQSIRRALTKAGAKLRLRRQAWGSGRRGTLTDTMRTTVGLFSTSNRRGSSPVNNGTFIRQMSLPSPLRQDLVGENERQKEALAQWNNHQADAAGGGGGGGGPVAKEEGRLLGNELSSASDEVLFDRCHASVDLSEEELMNERNSMKTCNRGSSEENVVESEKEMGMASNSPNHGITHAPASPMEAVSSSAAAAAAASGDSSLAIATNESCTSHPEFPLQERNPEHRASLNSESPQQIQIGCKGSDGEHLPTAKGPITGQENPPVNKNKGVRRKLKEASFAEIQMEFRKLDQVLAQLLWDAGIYE